EDHSIVLEQQIPRTGETRRYFVAVPDAEAQVLVVCGTLQQHELQFAIAGNCLTNELGLRPRLTFEVQDSSRPGIDPYECKSLVVTADLVARQPGCPKTKTSRALLPQRHRQRNTDSSGA